MEIGIFGGTFNPFHNGELAMAKQALVQLPLSKIIFIPNGNPPHKKEDVLDKELRFELLSAGIGSEPRFEASRLEIDRPGTSWTIDTLHELKQQLGNSLKMRFIMGEDNVAAFANYQRKEEFFQLCSLLVAARATASSGEEALSEWRKLLPSANIELLRCPANSVSSTEIRRLIRTGQPYAHLLPEPVFKLIEKKSLYLNEPKSLVSV